MHTKFLLFGITGDLSSRKILPALTHIVKGGECGPLTVFGVSRKEVDVKELILKATDDDTLVEHTSVLTLNLSHVDDYHHLKEQIDLRDDEQLVIYLSVPPGAAADIADFLGKAGINTPNVKLMFEKPFGYDAASAHDFVERTSRYFTEQQVYRIDHFMAKEVAMALLELRTDADNHEHHWDNNTVASIAVQGLETLSVEGRGHFYEQTGALRDLIQGHLMQLLSLVLMPVDPDFDVQTLPERRHVGLLNLKPANPEHAIRGQYDGYDTEVDNPGSTTETFAHIQLESSDPAWQGVPITLTTGKNLRDKKTVIVITYKDGTVDTFTEGEIKSSGPQLSDAYERVLLEAINGQKFIFTTAPEVIRSWEILAPIQKAWEMNDQPLRHYPVDSSVDEIIA